MTVLARFPRWLRRLLLAVNLAASCAVLAAFWPGTYPNLIATWVVGAAAAAVAVPAGAWFGRLLDARHAAHHDQTRAHVETTLAAHAEANSQRFDTLTDQIAALHARLDTPQGGTP